MTNYSTYKKYAYLNMNDIVNSIYNHNVINQEN